MTIHNIPIYPSTVRPSPPSMANNEGYIRIIENGDKEFATELTSGDTVEWNISPNKENVISHLDNIIISSGKKYFKLPLTKSVKDDTWCAVVGNVEKNYHTIHYKL